MFKTLKELFELLSSDQRKRFYRLQVLVVLMAFLELVGIASIGPFMALVADMDLIHTNAILQQVYRFTGLDDPMDFLFCVGIGVLVMLAIASAVSIITTWRLSMFSFSVGVQIADRLYRHYLRQNWLFHSAGSIAQLTKQIATECQRVTPQVINPVMQMIARLMLTVFIAGAIIIYDPQVALIGLAIFGGCYALIYRTVRRRLVGFGRQISQTNTERFRLMNEGFGGIKDILITGREQNFIQQFTTTGQTLAKAQGSIRAMSQIPRYFIGLLAFGALIGLVLILLKIHHGALNQVLPVLSVYTLAGLKLLPALQQIYMGIAQIKGNIASFEAIKPDLIASYDEPSPKEAASEKTPNPLSGDIHLDDISFGYPGKDGVALENISLSIPRNTTVGIVGPSGAGKSTAIDLILGLIDPDKGSLNIGNTPITPDNKHLWQMQLGFVPQSIFLSEGSITENIAFGLTPEQINLDKVKRAATLAHLNELIDSLPNGLDTKVGERGVQLSGGQRQRVGIARALYDDANVLVFDEATSALDGITENAIMTAIHELTGKKTIILIAHRLKTVEQCDQIYLLDKGTIIDQGSYPELLHKNPMFRKMAEHA